MSEITPEESMEVVNVLANDDGSHGPGDLENLPESDVDEPDGTDAA